jgi:hypothetical protein
MVTLFSDYWNCSFILPPTWLYWPMFVLFSDYWSCSFILTLTWLYLPMFTGTLFSAYFNCSFILTPTWLYILANGYLVFWPMVVLANVYLVYWPLNCSFILTSTWFYWPMLALFSDYWNCSFILTPTSRGCICQCLPCFLTIRLQVSVVHRAGQRIPPPENSLASSQVMESSQVPFSCFSSCL